MAPCSKQEPRRLDGSCNNLKHPPRGAPLTPYHRMLPATFSAGYEHRVAVSGSELPPARRLRTSLVPDGRVSSVHYSHLLTHWLVTITGEVTSLHDTGQCFIFDAIFFNYYKTITPRRVCLSKRDKLKNYRMNSSLDKVILEEALGVFFIDVLYKLAEIRR